MRFFDVGQGDAALIIGPTGKTVLVDGGPPDASASLAARVSALVKAPLDLVVLSHPHLDHLGGLTETLRAVGAKRVLDPGFDHPSKAYAEFLEFLAGRADVLHPERDEANLDSPVRIGLGEDAALTVLWPRRPKEGFLRDTRSDANSNSIVLRLEHGAVSFLFTGDAEAATEERLLSGPGLEPVTVLKVAHHGSRHSSTETFLSRIRPRFAVISSGAGNDYGHPSGETLERLRDVGATVYRTDLQGEVLAVSDGKSVRFETARVAEPQRLYVGERKGGGQDLRGTTRDHADALPAGGALPEAPSRTERARLPDGGMDWERYAALAPSDARDGPGGYVASRRSKVFHRADCANARKILEKNRLAYSRRQDAAEKRRPAGDCHP